LEPTASEALAELAYMSALARWLYRWQPSAIHKAVLAAFVEGTGEPGSKVGE
jgi:hypothetical protein